MEKVSALSRLHVNVNYIVYKTSETFNNNNRPQSENQAENVSRQLNSPKETLLVRFRNDCYY